ncbi:MAG: RnfABCDGE type electron transport complex subunit D [Ruminococcaceae bacterium]|nr:RnfABCDGE type electron transport complex subunit D [Oscillospiraceae bacterium]
MRLDNKRFLMSGAPHIRAEENTRSIMADVIIALIFPLIMAVYFFGWRALTLTAMSVLSCVFFERLYTRIAKKEKTGGDLSAIVTGMILALTLPVATPLWIPIIGGAFAIIVVKQLYGGLGKNFLNPALTARVFLLSFPSLVTLYTKPSLPAGSLPLFADIPTETLSPELIASITPLGKMKLGILPGIAMGSGDVVWGLRDVVVGNVAGAIGEVSAVVIAAAAIYLLVRRVITWHIPVSFVGTVAVLTFLFPRGGNAPWLWMLYSVCSGGLFFGAAFMATDYTTSPVTSRGKLLYGALCGVLTVLIRYFGAHEDGVMYAILVMNCATALVDRYIRPRRFGVRIKKYKEEAENE